MTRAELRVEELENNGIVVVQAIYKDGTKKYMDEIWDDLGDDIIGFETLTVKDFEENGCDIVGLTTTPIML